MDRINFADEKLRATLDEVLPGVTTSLQHSGVHNSTAAEHSGVVTEGDAADIFARMNIEHVMTMVALSHPGLTADQIVTIRRTLEGMSGSQSPAEMFQVAEEAARKYVTENEQQTQSQMPQQQPGQLWLAYEQHDKENAGEFEKLYQSGIITREQIDYMRRERLRLNELPKDSEERMNGEKAYVEYQHTLGIHLRDEAHAQGNADAEISAGKVIRNTDEQKIELEKIHSINQQHQGKEAATNMLKTNVRFEDDNTPASVDCIKMEVVDVQHNDVKAPTGAKGRTASKAEGKI